MTNDLTFSDFTVQLRGFISRAARDDHAFNALALALFELQFQHNAAYQTLCHARKVTPTDVWHWTEIHAVPTSAFKEMEMTSLPESQRTTVFHSSGTTEQRRSRHFHDAESLAIYQASLLPWFRAHLLPRSEKPTLLCLTPPPAQAPHSSLAFMFATAQRECGATNSCFSGGVDSSGAWTLDFSATLAVLQNSLSGKNPLVVLGTAFSFVHLLDELAARGISFALPVGSRVLETGGYKGRSRVLPKSELHALITQRLGVLASHIVCEFGMSEMSSQAYDRMAGDNFQPAFHFPPWARARVVSPETGREVAEGETGLLQVFDLANVRSVLAVQTEDLAARRGDGFELLGRAAQAESRGCSLMTL